MTSLPSGPAPIDASLHLLVDHLLDGLCAGDIAPALLHVTAGDREGFDLGVLPLDGRHPTDLLVGTTAPPEWHAVGMACDGWAYHAAERGTPGRRRARVHVVTVLSRSGELAHRTRVEGAGAIGFPSDRLDEDAPEGEQVDLLRRCLGLPTEPPPCPTAVYWAIRWLCEIVTTPRQDLADWDSVAALHPAVPVLRRSPGSAAALLEPLQVAPVARAFAAIFDWSTVRALLAEGRVELPGLGADDGTWFDDGAFARFLLNRCPSLGMLRKEAAQHLPGPLWEQLVATLASLDVPATSWPEPGDLAA